MNVPAARNPPTNVVIVGGDAPVWLAACVMNYALAPAGVTVTVIELPGRARPADVYATLPALEPLHTRLRIDEAKLIGATGGAFALGKNFAGIGGTPPFFHGYGATGARIDKMEFLPHWLKARKGGLNVAYEKFSLTATAARHGRMLLPDAETETFGFTDYGYHLPAIPYGAWLKQLALRRGVRLHTAHVAHARVDPQTFDITAVDCDGSHVAGDFFLDVSGGHAQLMSALPGAALESWRPAFVTDRVLTAYAPPLAPLPSYSEIRACANGWVALHASQACTHLLHAYSSEHASDAEATCFAAQAARLDLRDVHVRRVEPGRRALAWERNCVALGEAACCFDPVHSVDLQAVQAGLVHLLPLFPVSGEFSVERAEYNQNMRATFERIRDFQQAHYLLNRYGDSPFWVESRTRASIDAKLEHKIAAFRARGGVVFYEDETFMIDDWQSLLLGHGVDPETYDPAVDRTPAEVVRAEFQRILAYIKMKVEEQTSHSDYLRTVCAPGAAVSAANARARAGA